MDVETTGTEIGYHEIAQIAIVPLDIRLEVRKDVNPLYLHIKPEYPNRIDPVAMRVNGLSLQKLNDSGIDKIAALSIFEGWFNKVVPLNKSGIHRAKIIPLGHNYAQFDKAMIESWLMSGGFEYGDFFSHHCRDSMLFASFINDRHEIRGSEAPFKELNLKYVSNKLGIDNLDAHDALSDCNTTAKVYSKLCRMMENSFGAL